MKSLHTIIFICLFYHPSIHGMYNWIEPDHERIEQNRQQLQESDLAEEIKHYLRGYFFVAKGCRHPRNIATLSVSSDGLFVITGANDQIVRIWDTEHFPHTATLTTEMLREVCWNGAMSLSSDNQYLATASTDLSIKMWSLNDTHESPSPAITLNQPATVLSFSPDNNKLAAGSWNKVIRVWQSDQPEQPYATLRGHNALIRALCFSPDGRYLASGAYDKVVHFWDAANLNDQAQPIATLHNTYDGWEQTLCFSPDSRYFAHGCHDYTIRIWETAQLLNNQEPVAILRGHTGAIRTLSFSHDGNCLVSCSADCSIQIWNMNPLSNPASPLSRLKTSHPKVTVRAISFGPGNSNLLCAIDGDIVLYTPFCALDPNCFTCLIEWFKHRPSLNQLSEEEKKILMMLPKKARPWWLQEEIKATSNYHKNIYH